MPASPPLFGTPPQSPPRAPPNLANTAHGNLSFGFATHVGRVNRILAEGALSWIEDEDALDLIDHVKLLPAANPFPPADRLLHRGLFRVDGPRAFDDGLNWVQVEERRLSVRDSNGVYRDLVVKVFHGPSFVIRLVNHGGLVKRTPCKRIYQEGDFCNNVFIVQLLTMSEPIAEAIPILY